MDPDGFHRDNQAASAFWWFVPVPHAYYLKNLWKCTTRSFSGHVQPFQKRVGDEPLWGNVRGAPLGKLLHAALLEKEPNDRDVKTCAQWYELDKSCDIRDPDGFNRKSTAAPTFWCLVPVGQTYYSSRVSRCSTGSYMAYNHAQPFACSTRSEQEMYGLEENPLASLILSVLASPNT